MFILSIRSKRWNIAMQHIYFAEKPANIRKPMKLVCHTHSLVPSRKLAKSETVHIQLTDNERTMYTALSKNNQKKCFVVHSRKLIKYFYMKNRLKRIYVHFNGFIMILRKGKKIEQINKVQMESISLLNNRGALFLSEVRSICGQTLCYRLDIVHAKKKLCLIMWRPVTLF